MFTEPAYTYFQTAMILGVSRREIKEWISSGKLQAATDGAYVYIREPDLVSFLKQYPEHVGRVYCEDLPVFLEERKRIVEQISS